MLQRKPNQARYEFDIPGITKEHTLTDYLARAEGDSNATDGADFRLDRALFRSGYTDSMDDGDFDRGQDLDDLEMLALSTQSATEAEVIERGKNDGSLHGEHQEILHEAMKTVTDRQAQALWLWSSGMSEREAAAEMRISQPVFHEIVHGKNGVGGAFRKISKYFKKHPIT